MPTSPTGPEVAVMPAGEDRSAAQQRPPADRKPRLRQQHPDHRPPAPKPGLLQRTARDVSELPALWTGDRADGATAPVRALPTLPRSGPHSGRPVGLDPAGRAVVPLRRGLGERRHRAPHERGGAGRRPRRSGTPTWKGAPGERFEKGEPVIDPGYPRDARCWRRGRVFLLVWLRGQTWPRGVATGRSRGVRS